MSHPTSALDETVHQRSRLGILALLSELNQAEFTYLRDTLALTNGNLGGHLNVLGEAGYITINKSGRGRRSRTLIKITAEGRAALATELAALRALLDRYTPATASTEPEPAPTAARTQPPPRRRLSARVRPASPS